MDKDPNFDYLTRCYRLDGELYSSTAMAHAIEGDHDFLIRHGWVERFREYNEGGVMVLYKRPKYPHLSPDSKSLSLTGIG